MAEPMIRRMTRADLVRPWRGLGRWRPVVLCAVAALSLLGVWWAYTWMAAWTPRATLRAPGDTWPLAFSPDSSIFATSGTKGIALWDVATGREWATLPLPEGQPVFSGVFSPDGRTIAVVSSRDFVTLTISLIDAATGRVMSSITRPQTTLYGPLAFVDGGKTLRAILGGDGTLGEILEYDVEAGQVRSSRSPGIARTPGPIAVSADGRRMASANFGGSAVTLWDLETGRVVATLAGPPTAPNLAPGMAFSPDRSTLAVGRTDGTIELWDVASRKVRSVLRGHSTDYTCWGLAYSPDGRTFASRGAFSNPSTPLGLLRLVVQWNLRGSQWRPEDEVVVIDLATGRRLARAPSSLHPHYAPDGRTLATRNVDLSASLYDLPTAGRPPGPGTPPR